MNSNSDLISNCAHLTFLEFQTNVKSLRLKIIHEIREDLREGTKNDNKVKRATTTMFMFITPISTWKSPRVNVKQNKICWECEELNGHQYWQQYNITQLQTWENCKNGTCALSREYWLSYTSVAHKLYTCYSGYIQVLLFPPLLKRRVCE